MSRTAPTFRSLNYLTGEITDRPSTFMRALSEADAFCKERATVGELRGHIDALESENRELRARLAAFRGAGDAR